MPTLLEEALQQGYKPINQEYSQRLKQPSTQVPQFKNTDERLQYYGIDPKKANQVNKKPGFFQSVAQGVASPFLRAGTNVANIAESGYDLARGDYQGADEAIHKERDFGYFGKAKPVGDYDESKSLGQNLSQGTRDIVGTGAEIAPYFMGAFTPKGATLGPKVIAGAKTGATIGGVSSFGRALQRPDASLKSVAGETALGTAGGAAVGAAIPVIQTGTRKIFSATTGVPDDVLQRASSKPETIEYGRDIIKRNPKKPFDELANRFSQKLKSDKKAAAAAWTEASQKFKATGDIYYLNPNNVENLVDPLKKFGIRPVTEDGRVLLTQVGPKQLNPGEVAKLQEWVDELQNASRGLKPEELPAMREVFHRIYNEIPLGGVDKSPTKAHAAMMSLKEPFDDFLEKALPEDLKAADAMYRAYYDEMARYGKKIVDPSTGGARENAETFFNTLTNSNKGETQRRVGKEIVDRVQSIKDAQALSHFFAGTGGRTQDILRSVGILGLATGAGGPWASIPGLVASSPLVVGSALTGIGSTATKQLPKFLGGSTLGQVGRAAATSAFAEKAGEGLKNIFKKAREKVTRK